LTPRGQGHSGVKVGWLKVKVMMSLRLEGTLDSRLDHNFFPFLLLFLISFFIVGWVLKVGRVGGV
jgi:hypothetical protein